MILGKLQLHGVLFCVILYSKSSTDMTWHSNSYLQNGQREGWVNEWMHELTSSANKAQAALDGAAVMRHSSSIYCFPSVQIPGSDRSALLVSLPQPCWWQWWSWQDVSRPLLIMHDLISKTSAQCDLILAGKDCDIWGPALCHLRLGKWEDHLVPVVPKDTSPCPLERQ